MGTFEDEARLSFLGTAFGSNRCFDEIQLLDSRRKELLDVDVDALPEIVQPLVAAAIEAVDDELARENYLLELSLAEWDEWPQYLGVSFEELGSTD